MAIHSVANTIGPAAIYSDTETSCPASIYSVAEVLVQRQST